jgi:hypothetical protein
MTKLIPRQWHGKSWQAGVWTIAANGLALIKPAEFSNPVFALIGECSQTGAKAPTI